MLDYFFFAELKRCGLSCLSLSKEAFNLGKTIRSISSVRSTERSLTGKWLPLKGDLFIFFSFIPNNIELQQQAINDFINVEVLKEFIKTNIKKLKNLKNNSIQNYLSALFSWAFFNTSAFETGRDPASSFSHNSFLSPVRKGLLKAIGVVSFVFLIYKYTQKYRKLLLVYRKLRNIDYTFETK